MCFSATANFVGSGALAAVGVITLTRVKHRRELLFASLPTLFAVHQFIEGFVWLGLDGILSSRVTHDMGAAFMLYAQGLLPFLLPLSVLLFEPDKRSRQRMRPFLALGTLTTLYILWALTAYPTQVFVRGNSIVYLNPATNNTAVAILYVIATCGSLLFSKIKDMVIFGIANVVILLIVMAVKSYAFTWCGAPMQPSQVSSSSRTSGSATPSGRSHISKRSEDRIGRGGQIRCQRPGDAPQQNPGRQKRLSFEVCRSWFSLGRRARQRIVPCAHLEPCCGCNWSP
jgi:hypothetical protein